MMDQNNAISVLEELIQTCKDGQKGYQEAASKVKRSDLKTFFNEQSQERSRFADSWRREQSLFVDDPKTAVINADAANSHHFT